MGIEDWCLITCKREAYIDFEGGCWGQIADVGYYNLSPNWIGLAVAVTQAPRRPNKYDCCEITIVNGDGVDWELSTEKKCV